MAKYRFRYAFDTGSGICLWPCNEEGYQEFAYTGDARELPLPENTWRRVHYVTAWWDTCIDWNYPPDPSPWDEAERQRFNAEARKLLAMLREQLGPDFEIMDESGTAE